ncbi:MAG TPA: toxin glutamine deamidase domain-containing protein, partial [Candidatus Dormibacteraeota bacterium]
MGILAALTVVNVAQLGADPATDAAEVGVAATTEVAAGFTLASVGTMAIEGAFVGLSSDVVAQLGADVLDHLDPQFDQTGDHATSWFNPQEAVLSGLAGGAGGVLLGGSGLLFRGGAAPAIAGDDAGLIGDTPAVGARSPAATPAPRVFDASDTGQPVPSRLDPTTNTSPDLKGANGDPNPGPKNCSACVKAVDARMTGDPHASAGPMRSGVSFSDIENEWGGPVAQKGWSAIQTDMTQAGSGARGVMVLTEPNGAHIVNVVNDNGTVRILDGQIPKSAAGLSDYVKGTNFAGPNTQTYFRLTYSPPPPPTPTP